MKHAPKFSLAVLAFAALALVAVSGCSGKGPNGFPSDAATQRAAFKGSGKPPADVMARFQNNLSSQMQQNLAKHAPASQPSTPAGPAKL